MASLSRQLAQWIVGLRYEDLPPEVVDRAKGVTLHNIASALIGSQTGPGKQAVKMITEEEAGVRNGATAPRARDESDAAAERRMPTPRWRWRAASSIRFAC